MELELATLSDGTTIRYIPEVIGEGADKRVYFTENRLSVICLYKKQGDDALMLRRRLELFLGKYNPTVGDKSASYWKELFCWPIAIVEKPSLGILCPAYPKDYFFKSGELKGKEKKGLWYFGAKSSRLLDPLEIGKWGDFLAGCIVLARAVARLHRAGLAHTDLSYNNVLLDPLTRKATILIDVDNVVIPGLYPPRVLGTKGYIAPEVMVTMHLDPDDPRHKLPNIRTDRHALAVLIYQYLLCRHPLEGPKVHSKDPDEDEMLSQGEGALFIENPSDESNRPVALNIPFTILGKHLSDLFLQAFVDGLHDPDKRPTATQWESALLKTWDLIWPCENSSCTHKSFVLSDMNYVRCPWCGVKPPGTIAVVSLYNEGTSGEWVQSGQLAATQIAGLRTWHVYDNVQPGPDVDRTRQAYFAFHKGNWIMINEKLNSLTSAAGDLVASGTAVALTDGAQIRLSTDPHGRMAEVKLINV
jgi:hypothetical protein